MFRQLLLGVLAMTGALHAETKVLAFAGSTRADSYNKKLLAMAAQIAKDMGAQVTVIDLNDYQMPFYDADCEKAQGMPEAAKRLIALMKASNAMIIASPEYNASIPAVLKNAIDWASRSEDGKSSREAFKGKKFALMGAAPGKSGAGRGLVHLRTIISDIGGDVVSKQVTVPRAHEIFDNAQADTTQLKIELKEEMQELLK
ncbi:MAG TPA: NAD(P)H-dependent oxidoreductase [Chlamydiales bacterium]|nr:NAD(P)H-dependent oxidoreductase [Chlamydiales bacterium]